MAAITPSVVDLMRQQQHVTIVKFERPQTAPAAPLPDSPSSGGSARGRPKLSTGPSLRASSSAAFMTLPSPSPTPGMGRPGSGLRTSRSVPVIKPAPRAQTAPPMQSPLTSPVGFAAAPMHDVPATTALPKSHASFRRRAAKPRPPRQRKCETDEYTQELQPQDLYSFIAKEGPYSLRPELSKAFSPVKRSPMGAEGLADPQKAARYTCHKYNLFRLGKTMTDPELGWEEEPPKPPPAPEPRYRTASVDMPTRRRASQAWNDDVDMAVIDPNDDDTLAAFGEQFLEHGVDPTHYFGPDAKAMFFAEAKQVNKRGSPVSQAELEQLLAAPLAAPRTWKTHHHASLRHPVGPVRPIVEPAPVPKSEKQAAKFVAETEKHVMESSTPRRKYLEYCADEGVVPESLVIRKRPTPELNLAHQGIGDQRGGALAAALPSMPLLFRLNLKGNRLSDGVCAAIVSACAQQRVLKYLNLNHNALGVEALKALQLLGRTCLGLAELHIADVGLCDSHMELLQQTVAHSGSLLVLDIDKNKITPAGAKVLAPGLVACGSLQRFTMAWNKLGAEGVRIMVQAATSGRTDLRFIDISWNAIGDAGAMAVGMVLHHNASLQQIITTNNAIGGRGALVLSNGAANNTSLMKIDISGNPIGRPGARAMLRAVARDTGACRDIILSDCSLQTVEMFDPCAPEGMYTLDLRNPYDKTIAQELLRIAGDTETIQIAQAKFVGPGQRAGVDVTLRRFRERMPRAQALWKLLRNYLSDAIDITLHNNDQAKNGKPLVYLNRRAPAEGRILRADYAIGPNPWLIPDEGTFKCRVIFERRRPDKNDPPDDTKLVGVLSLARGRRMAEQERLRMLHVATDDLYFMTDQAQQLLETDLLKNASVHERVSTVSRLLFRIVDSEKAAALIEDHLTVPERMSLQSSLGQAYRLAIGNPTGHYRLDMSRPRDRDVILRLVEVNNANKRRLQERQPGLDTSQNKTGDGFRNENIDGVATVFKSAQLEKVGFTGVFEFDFVSTTRPPTRAKPIEASAFKKFLYAVGIVELSEMSEMEADSKIFEPLVPLEMVPEAAAAEKKPPATAGPPSDDPEIKWVDREKSPWEGPPEYLSSCTIIPNPNPLPSYIRVPPLPRRKDGKKKAPPATPKPPDSSGPAPSPAPEEPAAPAAPAASPAPAPTAASGGLLAFTSLAAAATAKPEPATAKEEDEPLAEMVDDEQVRQTLRPHLDKGRFPEIYRTDPLDEQPKLCRATCEFTARVLVELVHQSCLKYFTARQVERIIRLLPVGVPGARVEAFVILFERVVDLRNIERALWAFTAAERAQAISRIGILNLWNPMRPDGYYELDLAIYEQRKVAEMLVFLAVKEPGENWEDECYNDKVGWQLPASWIQQVPNKGKLVTTYTSTNAGCIPVIAAREELKARVLTWM